MRRFLDRLVVGLGLLLSLIVPAVATTPVSVVPALTRTAYTHDAMDCMESASITVIALTDVDGTPLHTAHYGPNGQDWGTVGKNPTPFAWLGGHGVQQVTTSEHLGPLYLTRYRLYSASLNRFLSSDPLGLAGGLNLYQYGNGDPLSYIDPLGLKADGMYESRTFISAYVPRSSEPVATLSDGSAAARHWMHANNFVTPPHMWGTAQADTLQNITYNVAAAEVAGGVIALGINSAINAARAGKAAAAKVPAAAKTTWPSTAQQMDDFLKVPGKRIPDTLGTSGRGKVEWHPNANTKIIFEQHPYHPNAPEWHKGPHFHLDTLGIKPHQRYVPGDPIPGY